MQTPQPIKVWEWALVYPAFWLISYVIGPIVERLPGGYRSYPKNTYRGI